MPQGQSGLSVFEYQRPTNNEGQSGLSVFEYQRPQLPDFTLRQPKVEEEQEQKLTMPTYKGAFLEGLGSGSIFISPEVSFMDLPFDRQIARAAGWVTGFAGTHLFINSFTGGSGTLAAASLKGAKGLENLKSAGQLWQQGKKTEAIVQSGFGIKGGYWGQKINPAATKQANDFFNLAAKNPEEAIKFLKVGQRNKEMAIWASYGQIGTASAQIQSGEPFDLKKQVYSLPLDVAGGALFSRGSYLKSIAAAEGKSFTSRIKVGLPEQFAAGFFAPGMNSAEAGLTERLITGSLMSAFGGIAGGMDFTSTKQSVSKAIRTFMPEIKEQQLADALAEYATQRAVKEADNIPARFSGNVTLTSRTGYTAKVKQAGFGKDGKFYLYYDAYRPNGTKPSKENVKRTIDQFLETYSSRPDNVTRVSTNVDITGNIKTFFRNDKEIKEFWEQKKWGIVTADNSDFGHQIPVMPGETPNDSLIRELLDRGYKESDIVRISKNGSRGYERGFIVKNLKETDAIEIAKITGQDNIVTHKGVYELIRNNKNNSLEVSEVILHSKIGGSTITAKTVEQGKTIIGSKNVTAGGGIIVSPKTGPKGRIQKKQGTGSGIHTPVDPSKFDGDVYNVTLDNGRVVAVANKVAWNRVTRKVNTSKRTLMESDIEKLRAINKKPVSKLSEDTLSAHTILRTFEYENGYRDSLGNGVHREIKELLFGKRKTNQLTKSEAETMLGIISTQAPDGGTGIQNIDDYIKNVLSKNETIFGKSILPMYRTYEYLYEQTGAQVFKDFSQILVKSRLDSEIIKGKFYTWGKLQQDLIADIDVDVKEFDSIMQAIIDPDMFGYLLENYSKSYIKKFDVLKAEHNKLMKEIFGLATDAKVKETVYVNGKPERIPIREVKNFMPRVVTDEFFEMFHKNTRLRDKVFLKLRQQNPLATDDELLQMYYRLGNTTEKKGIYGVQYSRTMSLEPVYFLDSKGNNITVDNKSFYNKRVGDTINGVEIAQRIETYHMGYGDIMDRYGGRISNIITLSKHLGDGIYRYGKMSTITKTPDKEYSDPIKKIFQQIDLQVKENSGFEKRKLKGLILNDLDIITGANGANQLASELTGWAATFGLSGVLSPVKNAILGSVQTYTTFDMTSTLRALVGTVFSKDFRKLYHAKYLDIGGAGSGMKYLDTSLNLDNLGFFRKNLVLGMSKTESFNRMVAVAAGDMSSENALKVLLDAKSSVNAKEKAARFLRDTLSMGDDYLEAVKNKGFTTEQKKRLLVRSHGLTQGISDPVFLPRIFNNEYVKPLTLFTRIATIVTDNVHYNVIKPAREGDVTPLGKYIAGSIAGGYLYAQIMHTLYRTEEKDWQSVPERVWSYLDYGEFLGAYGIASDVISTAIGKEPGVGLLDTFAVTRFTKNIALGAISLAKGVGYTIDDIDNYYLNNDEIDLNGGAMVKQSLSELSSVTALSSQLTKIYQGFAKSKNYKLYEEANRSQRQFLVKTGGANPGSNYYIPSNSESYNRQIHYQILVKSFYGGNEKDFIAAYRGAVNAKAYELEIKNQNTMTPYQAFRQAKKEVDEYLEKIDPIKLSKEKSGRSISRYDDWYSRLYREDPERLQEYMELNRFYKQNKYKFSLARQVLREKDMKHYQRRTNSN